MLVIQRCLSSSTCTLQPRSTAWTFRQKSLNDSTSRHRAASHEGRPQSVRLPNLKLSGGRQYSLVSNNRLLQRLECSASADSNYDAAYETGPTIVWYKHDLRIDDHPGLIAAVRGGSPIVPCFCFDPKYYTHLLRTPYGIEGLIAAVLGLRDELRQRGSDLVLLHGALEEVLPALAASLGAATVLSEAEVEYRWVSAVAAVQQSLPASVRLKTWQLDAYSDEPYCQNFRDFQQKRGEVLEAITAPSELTSLPSSMDSSGDEPSAETFRRAVIESDANLRHNSVLAVADELRSIAEMESPERELAQQLSGGEAALLPALESYLKCQDGYSEDAADSMTAVLREATLKAEKPSSPLASFPALFKQALSLGILSRRRVLQRVAAYQEERPRNWLSGVAMTAKSARNWAEAADFHWHLAKTDLIRETKTGDAPRHWRWRGFLVDYYTADCASPLPNAPAILLVHGFGAFGEQWRGQIKALTAAGYQVYAPTFPGYGRAEKPPVAYSQELWRDFLRDFVVEVAQRPVVLAGNSIGGFIGASLAADNPTLVQGLVLLNSAGKIDPSYQPGDEVDLQASSSVPPRLLVELFSRGLFLYLERSIASTLVKLYASDPTNADEWLADEIYRAACDPGAIGVFQSVFYLPKPRPLNYLVGGLFQGPTLVLNGSLDPLNNAVARAQALLDACPENVKVELLKAGHCPHDESPAEVNAALLRFIETRVLAVNTV